MIELRMLTPEDWRLWRELRLAALAEAPLAFGSKLADWRGDGDREERWRGRLGIPASHNVVALVDGQPAGMVSGVPGEQDGEAELISMWVSPAVRGRGVGDRLVGAVEEWARRNGATRLMLGVRAHNASAIALYRRNGFGETGVSSEPESDGTGCEILMAKPLGGPAG